MDISLAANFCSFTCLTMRYRGILLFIFGTSLLIESGLQAQRLSFRYLGSEEGLNSTTAYTCTIDQHGFIWIATNDGLVRFDGKSTKYFYHQDYPEMPADQIAFVFCDHRNAVWASTDKGLVRVDANLQLERQVVVPDQPDLRVFQSFESADSNIIAITADGAYSRPYDLPVWNRLPWLDSIALGRRYWDVRRFDRDRYTIVFPSTGVVLINLITKKLEAFVARKGVNCAIRLNEHAILIGGSGKFSLMVASIDSSFENRNIAAPDFFTNNDVHEEINYMTRASDGRIYLSTSGRGLLCYDSTLNLVNRYLHDPLNPSTLTSNSLKYVAADDKGNLALTSLDGINYTNVNNTAVDYFNYLKTNDGAIMDERILSMAEDGEHRLWICGRDQVNIHDPVTGKTQRLVIPSAVKLSSDQIAPIYVERDEQDNMWLGLRDEGILIFDPQGQFWRMLRQDDFPGFSTYLNRIRILREGADGYMYVGTESGLFRIAHRDFTIDTFANDLPLVTLRRSRVVDILVNKETLWISTSPRGAAWRYVFARKELKKFSIEEGLSSDRIYGMTDNGDGNVYIGTYNGFSIIHADDSVTNLLKGDGLISPRIECIEAALDGSIWMTNNYSLMKYIPSSRKMYLIGGRQGLRKVNFVIMSSTSLSSGKLAFGATKGFVVVDPDKVKVESDPLKVFLFMSDKSNREKEILPGTSMSFSYREQHLGFSFAVNDLMLADQVLYHYRLTSNGEGSWSAPSQNAAVDFNLKSGQYVLEVEAFDGHTWSAYESPLHFTIKSPWWLQGWFLMLSALSLSIGAWLMFKGRIEKYKRELQVTRQIADLESKALRAQMNPHFVFNSLNAIQECIVTGKIDEAYTYLSKFSRLLRLVLEHSDMAEVSLQSEMEVLDLYISLEKLRFKDEMNYSFDIEGALDTEEIFISPMLIQPHLENAIWHGLRHQDKEKRLKVTVDESKPGYLTVIIEDNGIGRVKAEELKRNRLGNQQHKSKGSRLSESRLTILQQQYQDAEMSIEDLYHEDGMAKGTKVILSIPILEKKNIPLP